MLINSKTFFLMCAAAIVSSCTSSDGSSAKLSKDEVAGGGKPDVWIIGDLCEIYDWYGDGECDRFCPDQAREQSDCGSDDACYVGGCSSQVCSDEEGVVSTCEWREEYACYQGAACERQADGECGWTQTDELRECLGEPAEEPCYVGGCSSQVCSDQEGVVTTCEWREEYACYQDATCERQADGQCGWTQDEELTQCLGGGMEEPCYVGGCSSQVCSDQEGVVTTCEWREEYACYQDATCERQADGQCGWTQDEELTQCLGGGMEEPCYVGGCSSQVCSDQEGVVTTCEWREEYACYQGATCERQASGSCGWTETPALTACLAGASD